MRDIIRYSVYFRMRLSRFFFLSVTLVEKSKQFKTWSHHWLLRIQTNKKRLFLNDFVLKDMQVNFLSVPIINFRYTLLLEFTLWTGHKCSSNSVSSAFISCTTFFPFHSYTAKTKTLVEISFFLTEITWSFIIIIRKVQLKSKTRTKTMKHKVMRNLLKNFSGPVSKKLNPMLPTLSQKQSLLLMASAVLTWHSWTEYVTILTRRSSVLRCEIREIGTMYREEKWALCNWKSAYILMFLDVFPDTWHFNYFANHPGTCNQ